MTGWERSRASLRIAAFADADQTLAPAGCHASYLEAQGANTVPRTWTLPLIDGLAYDVHNATGQDLTFAVAGGTGVTLATSKHCRIRCNATDYVQVTAAF